MNGSGRAPAKLNIDYMNSRGVHGPIPVHDLNSVTVPGMRFQVSSEAYTEDDQVVPPLGWTRSRSSAVESSA